MESNENNVNDFWAALKKKTESEPLESSNDIIDTEGKLQIFDVLAMNTILETLGGRDNLARNLNRYLRYLEPYKGWLQVTQCPTHWSQALDALQAAYPNFTKVIDFYRGQLALAVLNSPQVVSASPVLMVGQPGIGKTSFCQALAKTLNTEFTLVNLASVTAGFILGGMSSSWAEGKPGRVIETLARTQCANPVIVLDELDKATVDARYDPLGPLYQLLEHATAQRFIDEGLEVPVDCSHILWLATANDSRLISEALLSRFTVIELVPPDENQQSAVFQSIYSNLRSQYTWGEQFAECLPESVTDKLIAAQLPPRQIRRLLLTACGQAALRKSASATSCEIHPADIKLDDFDNLTRRIGFI